MGTVPNPFAASAETTRDFQYRIERLEKRLAAVGSSSGGLVTLADIPHRWLSDTNPANGSTSSRWGFPTKEWCQAWDGGSSMRVLSFFAYFPSAAIPVDGTEVLSLEAKFRFNADGYTSIKDDGWNGLMSGGMWSAATPVSYELANPPVVMNGDRGVLQMAVRINNTGGWISHLERNYDVLTRSTPDETLGTSDLTISANLLVFKRDHYV